MYATALIVFREILEAGLIIGIVLAATQNVPRRGIWILTGIGVGLLGAGIAASLADQLLSAMEGVGQEVFNATILFTAVLMLGWHIIWMQKHGRELAGKVRSYGNDIAEGDRPIYVLAIVVGLAVLREGAEVVLFLNGIAASGKDDSMSMLSGGLIGIVAGVTVGLLIYRGLLRIPSRHLFRVTTWLILLLAAGMAAQGVHYLEMANILPSIGGAIWNTSAILPDNSVVGRILHTLIGYTSQPNMNQLLAYVSTIVLITVLMKFLNRPQAQSVSAVATLTLAVMLIGATPNDAYASHKVYSPHVEKGEVEIEYRGHIDDDDRATHDNKRKDKFEVGYGFTDWWFSSIFFEYEKGPGDNYQHTATAWENIFQLTDQGKYWLDAGFYVEYESPANSTTPDKLELKLLLEKDINLWIHTANLIAARNIGSGSTNTITYGYAWSTKYHYNKAFEPGIEIYGGLGTDDNFGIRNNQNQQIGPAITGSFKLDSKSKLAYKLGYLFSMNKFSPDNTLMWTLELEKNF